MKKILNCLVLFLMIVLMLNACGSSDDAKPVVYDLFDTYDDGPFPVTPWTSYVRTSDSWTGANWSIASSLLYLNAASAQNSAFIYNTRPLKKAKIPLVIKFGQIFQKKTEDENQTYHCWLSN